MRDVWKFWLQRNNYSHFPGILASRGFSLPGVVLYLFLIFPFPLVHFGERRTLALTLL